MLAVKLQFIPASHDEDIKQKDLTFHTLLKKYFQNQNQSCKRRWVQWGSLLTL